MRRRSQFNAEMQRRSRRSSTVTTRNPAIRRKVATIHSTGVRARS